MSITNSNTALPAFLERNHLADGCRKEKRSEPINQFSSVTTYLDKSPLFNERSLVDIYAAGICPDYRYVI
jgi:hypothetical protein